MNKLNINLFEPKDGDERKMENENIKIIELEHDSDSIKEQIMDKKDEIMEIVGEELACCSKVLIEVVNGKIVIYELEYIE